jgi:dTDP-glucose 4,6-dehydratase
MSILVTGGAGFIGSNFLEQLLSDQEFSNSDIYVLDSLTYSGNLKNIEAALVFERVKFVRGSICDENLVNELAEKVDTVVNFAAESHVDRSIESRREFIETNVVGTQILLDAALSKSIQRFIQISTDEVYGSILSGSATEESVLSPNSPYSASKASADLIVRSYVETFGLNAIITRCTNNFGPKQHSEKLVPKTITKLMSGQNVPIYGNGRNIRDWIFVKDHCDGILAALKHGKSGEIYNISGANEMTNLEVVRKIMDIMNVDDNRLEFIPDRLGHDFRYSLNGKKASELLNFKPLTDFDTALKSTVNWYKDNIYLNP